MATWQSELLLELRTQPVTADLKLIMEQLEQGVDDVEHVASELTRIDLGYFGNHVQQEFYHLRAMDVNKQEATNV